MSSDPNITSAPLMYGLTRAHTLSGSYHTIDIVCVSEGYRTATVHM